MRHPTSIAALVVAALLGGRPLAAADRGPAWVRHTVDASSRGADGVRLADVDGDGLPDVATGWEEGGRVRVCLNPGPARARRPWPAVTVGRVGSPEDAAFVDLDGDGSIDVVSCCEGETRGVFVHWAPRDRGRYLDPDAWRTAPIPAAAGRMQMFCLPMQVDGRGGIDLVVGSKGRNAQVGWLEAPEDPRDLAAWRWHRLCDAGWVMSLVAADVDGDGDRDVIASDRKGPGRGCFWLENPGPGPASARPWPRHPIGAEDVEVMFLTVADLDRDGRPDVLAAARGTGWSTCGARPTAPPPGRPIPSTCPPAPGRPRPSPSATSTATAGPTSSSRARAPSGTSGVVWLSSRRGVTDRAWEAHEVSGPEGVKYDLVELVDLDGDGDLDALTCEERDNLGVVWYENPTRR